jgi:6-phosphogluconate dehydrogenase
MEKAVFGIVGMGVMGRNLALNIASHGFPVAVYNRTDSKTTDFINGPAKDKAIIGTFSYDEFADSLEKPRRIMLMVKAGPAVDAVIKDVKPYLEKGDILIDGGNSFYRNTERRTLSLKKDCITLALVSQAVRKGHCTAPASCPVATWKLGKPLMKSSLLPLPKRMTARPAWPI